MAIHNLRIIVQNISSIDNREVTALFQERTCLVANHFLYSRGMRYEIRRTGKKSNITSSIKRRI